MSDLLTVSEVARILRVDDTTVRRWVKAGALEAVVLPHVNARQASYSTSRKQPSIGCLVRLQIANP